MTGTCKLLHQEVSSFASLHKDDYDSYLFNAKLNQTYLPEVDDVLLSTLWSVGVKNDVTISFIKCAIDLLRHFNFLELFNAPDLQGVLKRNVIYFKSNFNRKSIKLSKANYFLIMAP